MTNEGPVFIFNGDADGIIAQHIMHLNGVFPRLRISGVKRDIQLLSKLPPHYQGEIFVFDISLRQNAQDLHSRLNDKDLRFIWFDHHEPGIIPSHPRLEAHIHEAAETCTALIVDRHVPNSHPLWAAAAAFGDNLAATGAALLKSLGISPRDMAQVERLGVLLNYNAYGESVADLYINPVDLAEKIAPFKSPLDFIREGGVLEGLEAQYLTDKERCHSLRPHVAKGRALVYVLPAGPWSRRYGSTWANEYCRLHRDKALAVLKEGAEGGWVVSIRAPKDAVAEEGLSAASLALEFPTGGGRKLAAGINHLSAGDQDRFVSRFLEYFQ